MNKVRVSKAIISHEPSGQHGGGLLSEVASPPMHAVRMQTHAPMPTLAAGPGSERYPTRPQQRVPIQQGFRPPQQGLGSTVRLFPSSAPCTADHAPCLSALLSSSCFNYTAKQRRIKTNIASGAAVTTAAPRPSPPAETAPSSARSARPLAAGWPPRRPACARASQGW